MFDFTLILYPDLISIYIQNEKIYKLFLRRFKIVQVLNSHFKIY